MPPLARALLPRAAAVLTVVIVALFLAAPAHELLLDLGWLRTPATEYDYDKGFLKVLRRLLIIPLALVVFLFEKPWRDGHPRSYGLLGPTARIRSALLAFALTALALVAVLAGQFVAGWLRWEDPLRWGTFAGRLGRMLLGGVALAVVEEWFFRGWAVRRLGAMYGFRAAVLVSAFVFALLHAFRPSSLHASVSHDALGALTALLGWLGHMLDPVAFGPSFVGLFLFALLLSAAYRRTGSLWTAIGIHAGAVWVIFSYGALTERYPARTWAGTRWLYDGPPVWILLALGAWILWPRESPRRDTGSEQDLDESGAPSFRRPGSSARDPRA